MGASHFSFASRFSSPLVHVCVSPVCVCVCVRACMWVTVRVRKYVLACESACVRAREREILRKGGREPLCVCVLCVVVCVCGG
jgi:hypothetical protein